MPDYEAVSLTEIADRFQKRLASRREAIKNSAHPTDPQSIIAIQAALLAGRHPHGTTIVAVAYENGVCMAADRLATQGWGDVFSRATIKLYDIDQNAVIGICGWLAFAQHVIEDMEYICEMLAKQNKRPVSIPGKSNLLKQIIEANRDEFLYRFMGVSFGAILGGYDRVHGPAILSFETDGGVYSHEQFAVDGSGYTQARDFLDEHFQYDMSPDEAVACALGAIRKAGKFVTSVSHPMDDPPATVKLITKTGVKDIAEEAILGWILATERKEQRRLYAKRNRSRRRTAPAQEPTPEGGSHGTA